MTGTAGRYWLGTGAREVEHLVAQAEAWAPAAAELLDRIGLPAGASAIDVGCGVLGIAPMSQRSPPTSPRRRASPPRG